MNVRKGTKNDMDTCDYSALDGASEPLNNPDTRVFGPPKPFQHQTDTTERLLSQDALFITSDAGTGKTRAVIDAIKTFADRTLILAPKSILQAAWGNDIDKFAPCLSYTVATANNKVKAFKTDAKVVITNHDMVNWLKKNKDVLQGFGTLVIDESTAFKNPKADRSKSVQELTKLFQRKVALSGTPTPNSIVDIWHQVYLLDRGEHLGPSFYKFRNIAQENKTIGAYPNWVDKEGIGEVIANILGDIVIRYKLEDCIDIPPNHTYTVAFELSDDVRDIYDEFRKEKLTEINGKDVTATQASTVIIKLLQIASGAVYSDSGTVLVDGARYELILDLVEQRKHSVVAFIWGHQKDQLVARAKKRGIKFGVIDGTTSLKDRTQLVEDYQAGKLQTIFAHPQSAGHGLTLTRGTATIWASPTYNYELYEQFNRRIYRATQSQKTETIHIVADDTVDRRVYDALQHKQVNMRALLCEMTHFS